MKLYAPKYYKDFVCIADRCCHSCCIGWEIDIDESTMDKYRQDGDILKSIDCSGAPHFRLTKGERCPHLAEDGLCRIILSRGEDYLCDICREHPRFYNETPKGMEVGIGLACEEAGRLIITCEDYREIIEIGELDGEAETESTFDAFAERDRVYAILSDLGTAYEERLKRIYDIYDVAPSRFSDNEWCELIEGLEYLNDRSAGLFMSYTSGISTPMETEKYAERVFAYFIFRHCAGAKDAEDFRMGLGFGVFCERLLVSILKKSGECDVLSVRDIARVISEELEYNEDNSDTVKFRFADAF